MSLRSLGFAGEPRRKCRVPPPRPPCPSLPVSPRHQDLTPSTAQHWESTRNSGLLCVAAPRSPRAIRPSRLLAVTVAHICLAFDDLGSLGEHWSDSGWDAPLSGFVGFPDHGPTGARGLGEGVTDVECHCPCGIPSTRPVWRWPRPPRWGPVCPVPAPPGPGRGSLCTAHTQGPEAPVSSPAGSIGRCNQKK